MAKPHISLHRPIGSLYAIYGNIYHQYTPNVSIYTIHGSYERCCYNCLVGLWIGQITWKYGWSGDIPQFLAAFWHILATLKGQNGLLNWPCGGMVVSPCDAWIPSMGWITQRRWNDGAVPIPKCPAGWWVIILSVHVGSLHIMFQLSMICLGLM